MIQKLYSQSCIERGILQLCGKYKNEIMEKKKPWNSVIETKFSIRLALVLSEVNEWWITGKWRSLIAHFLRIIHRCFGGRLPKFRKLAVLQRSSLHFSFWNRVGHISCWSTDTEKQLRCWWADTVFGKMMQLPAFGLHWKWKVKMKSLSCVRLCPTLCDPRDCSTPGFPIHGIFQARELEWIAISFSMGSSWPGDPAQVSRIVGRRFTLWATRVNWGLNHALCYQPLCLGTVLCFTV